YISFGTREYWNKKDGHYLGPAHDAVPLRVAPDSPLDFGRPERGVSRRAREVGVGLIEELGRLRAERSPRDEVLAARIASYELAFRMQRSVPEAVVLRHESEETKALYGLHLPHCREFGMQMLAARRLVERGVRFIQVQHGGGGAGAWDAHSGLRSNHERNALA